MKSKDIDGEKFATEDLKKLIDSSAEDDATRIATCILQLSKKFAGATVKGEISADSTMLSKGLPKSNFAVVGSDGRLTKIGWGMTIDGPQYKYEYNTLYGWKKID